MTVGEAKCRFIVCLTLMMVVLGFGGAYVLNQWWPEAYPTYYPSIPVFFYLYGMVLIHCYERYPERWLFLHILGKGVKLILGIAFIGAYIYIIGTNIRSFILIFLCYYLLYLAFENGFFLRYEMKLKKEIKR